MGRAILKGCLKQILLKEDPQPGDVTLRAQTKKSKRDIATKCPMTSSVEKKNGRRLQSTVSTTESLKIANFENIFNIILSSKKSTN